MKYLGRGYIVILLITCMVKDTSVDAMYSPNSIYSPYAASSGAYVDAPLARLSSCILS